jgi:hypothetical protein
MHSPFLLSGGRQIHTAEPLVLYFTSFAPKMVDPRSIVGATLSRYPITMKGVKKAIYTVRFDDRDDKAQTQDRFYWRFETPCSLREQRSDSPQGPAHLVFHRLTSLFRPRSIHSPAHQAIPSLGIAVRQYTGILAPLVLFGSRSRPQVSPPSQCPVPATLATSFRTLTFIIK